MPAASPLSTRVLLVCAAIGVATGILSAVAGYLAVPVWGAAFVLYGLVLGVHVVPGVIAQELLRMPGVALATHLLAALVASAFSPQWIWRHLGTALLIGALQEGVAALTRYRSWQPWRFFVSSVVVGVVLAVVMGFAFDVTSLPAWAAALFLSLLVVGPVVWAAIAIGIGGALRRAGVARTTARR